MSKIPTSTYRTAESVSPHHPDKLCDQISDAILDAYLTKDTDARVAVETVGGHGKVFITGEVTSKAQIDVAPIVARIAGDVQLDVHLVHQSPEIAQGVDAGGAGPHSHVIPEPAYRSAQCRRECRRPGGRGRRQSDHQSDPR